MPYHHLHHVQLPIVPIVPAVFLRPQLQTVVKQLLDEVGVEVPMTVFKMMTEIKALAMDTLENHVKVIYCQLVSLRFSRSSVDWNASRDLQFEGIWWEWLLS